MPDLTERLNQVLPRLVDPDLLSGRGLGNEIAFYVFDYPARSELEVRDHLAFLEQRLASDHADLDVVHIDLFEAVSEYLDGRGLLQKSLEMEAAKGTAGLLQTLQGPVSAEKITEFMVAKHALPSRSLVLISGVGRAWPLLRAHSLLNCLHPVMGHTPVVMFYPGDFDGTALRLFGGESEVASSSDGDAYYRAFPLVPR